MFLSLFCVPKKVTKKGHQQGKLNRFFRAGPTPLRPKSIQFTPLLDPHRTPIPQTAAAYKKNVVLSFKMLGARGQLLI
jgi:hypothetical protein